MKKSQKNFSVLMIAVPLFFIYAWLLQTGTATAFQPLKGNMASFNPSKADNPVTGDTIKVGLINPFSGAASSSGELFYLTMAWVAHDINTQGGLFVDGKMKKIQFILGDTQVKPQIANQVIERLILEDKVDVLVGTAGTHIAVIAQALAGKYKKIFVNNCSYSDLLLDDKHWNPYVFQVCPNTTQWTLALASYYVKRPEKKFYLLCQDYAYGHAFAETFKTAIKKFKPEAQIVGEDFHAIFLKDFAPYLTKVQASNADVIITTDWSADNENLLKQSRQMGMKTPVASIYVDDPNVLQMIGGPAGAGMTVLQTYIPSINTPLNKKFNELWNVQWKTWQRPYNHVLYKWPANFLGSSAISLYWLFDVMQRAKTTNSDALIKIWEGDKYESITGPLFMRPQDHLMLSNIFLSELVFPNKWFDNNASWGPVVEIPRAVCTPPVINGRK
jgi:branched-chain amino acid transport system substrate-binding protein